MHPDDFFDLDDLEIDDDCKPDPGGLAADDLRDATQLIAELPEPVPSTIELEKIPPRLWEQTLAPLYPQQRGYIVTQVKDKRLNAIAWRLIEKFEFDTCARRDASDLAHHRARRTGHPLPTPGAEHAVVHATVQVNVRMRADDHDCLKQAAAAVGMKPTTLARALMLNGAAKILQERAA